MDPEFRRLRYCRYADDFIIGIIGSLEDAKRVYARVEQFLNKELNLEVAAEKSKINHSEDGTLFLGHEVRMYTGNKVMKVNKHLKRTTVKRMQLHVPRDRMVTLMKGGKFGDYEHGWASHNPRWLQREDVEILLAYNAVMRGFVNYYSLIVSPHKELGKLVWLMRTSFLKTLASKHKSTVAKTAHKLRLGRGDLGIQVEASKGKRTYKLFSMKDFKKTPKGTDVDVKPNVATVIGSRTSLVKRLQVETCEFCEQEGGYLEVHHVRKLKDVQKGKSSWQKQMAEMRRKTIVLCVKCHDALHAGTLADRRRKA
jgi:RNA-directed DNA polymerase